MGEAKRRRDGSGAPLPFDPAAVLAEAQQRHAAGDAEGAWALTLAAYRQAPTEPRLAGWLGILALQRGDYATARQALETATAGEPEAAGHWVNLGNARRGSGDLTGAAAAYEAALQRQPELFTAWINLGNVRQAAGAIDAAVDAAERALQCDPEAAEAWNNLGNLYKEQGRYADALRAYDTAIDCTPDLQVAWSNRLALLKVSPTATPDEVAAAHRRFAAYFEPRWRGHRQPFAQAPVPDRRLRIGYVSPDCHTALPPFIDPVLRAHDRSRFEVFAYFNNPQRPERLAGCGTISARVMRGVSDEQVAQQIRADQVDLLVDLAGHTGHSRLGVFGRRPAPLQLTWLDYLNTTGLDAIDLRLTDAVADPPGQTEAWHSERLACLTPTQWCWQPPTPLDEANATPLPALARGYLTFGSFNNAMKLTEATLATWAQLLQRLPEARLLVVGVPEGRASARIREALAGAGERVRLLARVEPDAFRALLAEVDVALDPFPFSGATTTLEALWRGLPVLTLAARFSAGRSSASLLTALGMTDWIARDTAQYVELAVAKARETSALAELRATLPSRMLAAGLCDFAGFTRRLETIYREAWQDWCRAQQSARAGLPAGSRPLAVSSAEQAWLRDDAALLAIRRQLEQEADGGADEATLPGLFELVERRPEWVAAQQTLIPALLRWARANAGRLAVAPQPLPAQPPTVSVVVCSIDAPRFATVSAAWRTAFAPLDIEIVGIHDARSLCEGYNRGAAQARGELLLFSHDDVAPWSEDFAARLLAHLQRADVVGVFGCTRLAGPRIDAAGFAASHGLVPHPRGNTIIVAGGGLAAPLVTGIQALDGLFFAARRHVWESVRFDEATFDGFHFYDLDFSCRAAAAGHVLGVGTDLLLAHWSTGNYDRKWTRYRRRFQQKFVDLLPAQPQYHPPGLSFRVGQREQVELLWRALRHWRFGARGRPGGPC